MFVKVDGSEVGSTRVEGACGAAVFDPGLTENVSITGNIGVDDHVHRRRDTRPTKYCHYLIDQHG